MRWPGLPPTVPAFALAPITYGKSEEHLHFPGTMTLTGETLLATMIEIGESVYRSGFRKLLIVNGHGGQPQVHGDRGARDCACATATTSSCRSFTWRLPNVAGRYMSDKEKKLAMHAGHAETALMLALAPDTVHMERAVANYPPEFPSKLLSPDGRPACAWTARDFGPSGVIGDPLPAHARARRGDPRLARRQLGAGDHRAARSCAGSVRDEATWGRGQQTGFIQQRLD